MPGRGKQLEGELSKKDSKYSKQIVVCECGVKMSDAKEKKQGFCGLCRAKKEYFDN